MKKGIEGPTEGSRPNPFDKFIAQRAAAEVPVPGKKSVPSPIEKNTSWVEFLKIMRWEAAGVKVLQTIQAPG